MTDERFNHLETQITELREFIRQSTMAMQESTAAMQQNITVIHQNNEVMQQNMTVMQQDLNSLREDMTTLGERVDLIEETVTTEIRKGFKSLRNHLDDLSTEGMENHRNTFDEDLNKRRLDRRIPAFDKREDD